ncbi:MAG: hypothetical protein JWR26_924 [Pedosphaera sp.]|nr:hypothetical protein [Pedosphaera sp.]
MPLRKESPQWGCDRRTSRTRESGPKIGRSPSVFTDFFALFHASFPVSTPPRIFMRWLQVSPVLIHLVANFSIHRGDIGFLLKWLADILPLRPRTAKPFPNARQ